MLPACLDLRAARKEFWDSKDPASWSNEEKQVLLGQSPWAQQGLVRMEAGKEPAHDTRLREQREAGRRHAGP